MKGNPGLTAADLCSGIGGFHLAAARNGITTVFASDNDPQAADAYFRNLGIIPYGDVRIAAERIPPHDILMAGFPCQPFSVLGKGRGLEDPRGGLIRVITDIVARRRPKAALLENVSRLASHEGGLTLERITAMLTEQVYAVSWRILDARDFGLPQQRRRIFIAAISPGYGPVNWPRLRRPRQALDAVLERSVPPRYYATEAVRTRAKARLKSPAESPSIWHTNRAGAVTARPYSAALRADGSHNYLLVEGERRLTEKEMLRLQGFPEDYRLTGSYRQARRHTGNAVAVPAAAAALRSVKNALERPREPEKAEREALLRIKRLADALAARKGTWEAQEDILDMAGECGRMLQEMLAAK